MSIIKHYRHPRFAFVKSQLPDHIVNNYDTFVSFIEAYYEYMDQNFIDPLFIRDLDETIDMFVDAILRDIDKDIPDYIKIDKRLFLKHIRDLYESKGSPQSYKLLFRILFDSDVEVTLPSKRILRASDGRWIQPVKMVCQVISGDIDNVQNRLLVGTTTKTQLSAEYIRGYPRTFTTPEGETRSETVYWLGINTDAVVGRLNDWETVITKGNITFQDTSYYEIKENIATIVTTRPHGLLPGDKVNIKFQIDTQHKEYIVDYVSDERKFILNNVPLFDHFASADLYIENEKEDKVVLRVLPTVEKIEVVNGGSKYESGDKIQVWQNGELLKNCLMFVDRVSAARLIQRNASFSQTGNIVTVTTTAFHGFDAGDAVNLEFPFGVATGNYIVDTVIDPTKFTVIADTLHNPDHLPLQGTVDVADVGSSGRIQSISVLDVSVGVSPEFDITIQSETGTGAIIKAYSGPFSYTGGYYRDDSGLLSNNQIVLQDNKKFQTYSYVLRASESINIWRNAVKKLIHPAGTRLNGELVVPLKVRLGDLTNMKMVTHITAVAKVTPKVSLAVNRNLQTASTDKAIPYRLVNRWESLKHSIMPSWPVIQQDAKDVEYIATDPSALGGYTLTNINYDQSVNGGYWFDRRDIITTIPPAPILDPVYTPVTYNDPSDILSGNPSSDVAVAGGTEGYILTYQQIEPPYTSDDVQPCNGMGFYPPGTYPMCGGTQGFTAKFNNPNTRVGDFVCSTYTPTTIETISKMYEDTSVIYATFADLPTTGDISILYVIEDENRLLRWSPLKGYFPVPSLEFPRAHTTLDFVASTDQELVQQTQRELTQYDYLTSNPNPALSLVFYTNYVYVKTYEELTANYTGNTTTLYAVKSNNSLYSWTSSGGFAEYNSDTRVYIITDDMRVVRWKNYPSPQFYTLYKGYNQREFKLFIRQFSHLAESPAPIASEAVSVNVGANGYGPSAPRLRTHIVPEAAIKILISNS